MVTFSRGSRPMRPRRCESVTLASGQTSRTIWPARSSSVASSGEKHGCDRHGAYSGVANLSGRGLHRRRVERHDRAPVVFVAAANHEVARADGRGEVGRPVREGLQEGGRRLTDADRGGRRQPSTFHDGVGEMRRAQHDGVDAGCVRSRHRQQCIERCRYARAHIGRSRRLDIMTHFALMQQHGVGAGPADVDPDDLHRVTD